MHCYGGGGSSSNGVQPDRLVISDHISLAFNLFSLSGHSYEKSTKFEAIA